MALSIFDPLLFDARLLNPKIHAALHLMRAEQRHAEDLASGATGIEDLAISLEKYSQAAWPLIEPTTALVWNWHLRAISEHLEAVTDGEIQKLVITVPPRSGKSSLISVFWPTWSWIDHPEMRWLFASYAQTLSTRDALRSRRVIQSAWYQRRWSGRFNLTGDQNQKTRYENDKTGYRIATSVGGSATGEGGSVIVCLPYEAEVQTKSGLKPIGLMVETRDKDEVLCYNHVTSQAEYQPIEAWERSDGRPLVRVVTDQTVLTCTLDHPVYVIGHGYVKAEDLRRGDEVLWHDIHMSALSSTIQGSSSSYEKVLLEGLSVWSQDEGKPGAEYIPVSAVRESFLPIANPCNESENWPTCRNILQSEMFWPLGTWDSKPWMDWWQSQNELCPMLERNMVEAVTAKGNCDVQQEMSSEVSEGPSYKRENGCFETMPSMWNLDVYQIFTRKYDELLLSRMQEYCSQRAHAGAWQWEIHPRRGDETVCSEFQQSPQRSDSRERWLPVSPLWNTAECLWQAFGYSSHELQQGRHQDRESCKPLPILPRTNARRTSTASRMVPVVVTSVERLEEYPPTVYNIRTSLHNYFADGLLVHNCDDPHNLLEIHSDTIREGVLTWWDEVMSSRLNDPKTGAHVIVQQRAHERDLAGHVLAQGGYTHLNLPMEYEPTTYVFHGHQVDPRTETGELLCPERIGPSENEDLKIRLGPTAYHGQYNQKPAPAGGNIFKRWWWRYWQPKGMNLPPIMVQVPGGDLLAIHAEALPESFDEVIESWDCAFKDLSDSDFVAGHVWGRQGANKYLLDRDHRRMDFPETQKAIRAMSAKWPQAHAKLIEDKANGPAIIASMRQEIPGMIAVDPGGGKVARAHAVTPAFEAGNVYVPHPHLYPWVDAYLHEHDVFPAGAHDDDVDATTQALKRWVVAFKMFSQKVSGV